MPRSASIGSPDVSRTTDDSSDSYPHLGRWLHALVLVAITFICLAQSPGVTTFDTKLDLTQDPGSFMRQTLTVWTPDINMGSLQNQAYGYLFPTGPYYLLGDLIGAPMWLWQRLWSLLILVIAFEGMRLVLRALGGSTPVVAIVAASSYAFAPRVLGTVGVLSGQTLPGAVLPWTVLPLVLAHQGRLGWRRAVVLSAATVPFMGGVNATEVMLVLLLPGLLVLMSGGSWRSRWRRTAAWSGLIILVCIWWIGPLLVLGTYAPPFLDYVESARNTTAPVGFLQSVQGTTHWLSYLDPVDSDWYTAFRLSHEPVFLVASAAVGICGLVGLTLRRTPLRLPLAVAAFGALAFLTLGHGGVSGSPLQSTFLSFLDGGGAPFRNIHKVDPLVRFAVAVGLTSTITVAAPRVRRLLGWDQHPDLRHLASGIPAAVAFVLVASSLVPAAAGQMRSAKGWKDIPQPWLQMSETLQKLPAGARTLVVPGADIGDQTWGRTVDELIQTFPGVNWASRSKVPLVSNGGIRFLDEVENAFWAGRGSTGLVQALASAGFTNILVRNDIAAENNVPDPDRVHQAIAGMPGLSKVKAFGVGQGGYPMVELYSLRGASGSPLAVPMSQTRVFYGEADNLVRAYESGAIRGDEVTVSNAPGDTRAHVTDTAPARLVTEGWSRQERSFARVHESRSSVMTEDDEFGSTRAQHDYGPMSGTQQATAVYSGVSSVRVSSTADSAGSLGPVRPDLGAWAAVDGRPDTAWVSAGGTDPRQQWIAVDLDAARTPGKVDLKFRESVADVKVVRLVADSETKTVRLDATGAGSTVLQRPTKQVKVEVVTASGAGQVGLSDLRIAGLSPQRSIQVPTLVDAGDSLVFTDNPGRTVCTVGALGVGCNPLTYVGPDESTGISRDVEVVRGRPVTVDAQVVPTGGEAVDNLLLPLKDAVAVRASGSYVTDVRNSPTQAADGSTATTWIPPQNGTVEPWLDLSWGPSRTLSTFKVGVGPGATPAPVAGVTVDGRPAAFTVSADGTYRLTGSPKGTSLRVYFTKGVALPQIAEVQVDALRDLYYRPADSTTTGLPCGLGPPIHLGSAAVETEIVGTIGQLRSGAPMQVRSCGLVPDLKSGRQTISIDRIDGFTPVSLQVSAPGDRQTAQQRLTVTENRWTEQDRSVTVAGGPVTVLAVPENFNAGWTATMGGRTLTSVLVNGWQQGWVVPAGSAARQITMSFTPAKPYQASLLVGALAALAVLVAAMVLLVAMVRERVGVRGLLAGLSGAGSGSAPDHASASEEPVGAPAIWWVAVVVVLAALFGGAFTAVGVVVALVTPWRWRSIARTAAVAVTVLAAILAASADFASAAEIADGATALVLGLLVGLVLRSASATGTLRRPHWSRVQGPGARWSWSGSRARKRQEQQPEPEPELPDDPETGAQR